MINEAKHEAGGIYLFENEAALVAFLNGPLATGTMAHPALSGFSAKRFDVLEEPTAVTHGPVEVASPA